MKLKILHALNSLKDFKTKDLGDGFSLRQAQYYINLGCSNQIFCRNGKDYYYRNLLQQEYKRVVKHWSKTGKILKTKVKKPGKVKPVFILFRDYENE